LNTTCGTGLPTRESGVGSMAFPFMGGDRRACRTGEAAPLIAIRLHSEWIDNKWGYLMTFQRMADRR
jgi:hypothetical protein